MRAYLYYLPVVLVVFFFSTFSPFVLCILYFFLFYKKYDKPYSDLSWYLEDGAKEFVKAIEDSWNANTFDSFTLYHDQDFLEYLAKYWDGGFDEDTLSTILDDLREDVIEELESLNKADIEYIIDTYGDDLVFSVDELQDTINLEDFLEDNDYLWDEDDDV